MELDSEAAVVPGRGFGDVSGRVEAGSLGDSGGDHLHDRVALDGCHDIDDGGAVNQVWSELARAVPAGWNAKFARASLAGLLIGSPGRAVSPALSACQAGVRAQARENSSK
ncbi:MAG TPA: hypothetical protein VMU51_16215 [Mycobacteriales bacterium]|nr:hypothetical protein [Mycobacteriales bacterium]